MTAMTSTTATATVATPKTRIYVLSHAGGPRRLVRARNAPAAVRHVAADSISCATASQQDLIDLLPGTKVEDAGAADTGADSGHDSGHAGA